MKTILIIEDSHNSETLSSWIHSEDRQVLRAETLAEIQNSLEQTEPDLILLDDSLLNDMAYDYLDKLKSKPQTAKIPIVFILGEDHRATDRKRAQKAGANDVILKSSAREELNDIIDTTLKGAVLRSLGLSSLPMPVSDATKNKSVHPYLDENRMADRSIEVSKPVKQTTSEASPPLAPVSVLSPESLSSTAKPLERQGFDLPLSGLVQDSVSTSVSDSEKSLESPAQAAAVSVLSPESLSSTAKPLERQGFDLPLSGLVQDSVSASASDSEKSLESSTPSSPLTSTLFSFGKLVQSGVESEPNTAGGAEQAVPFSVLSPDDFLTTAKPFKRYGFKIPLSGVIQVKPKDVAHLSESGATSDEHVSVNMNASEASFQFDSQVHMDVIRDEVARATRVILPEILNETLKDLLSERLDETVKEHVINDMAPQIQTWIDKRIEVVMIESVAPQLKTWFAERVSKLLEAQREKDGSD